MARRLPWILLALLGLAMALAWWFAQVPEQQQEPAIALPTSADDERGPALQVESFEEHSASRSPLTAISDTSSDRADDRRGRMRFEIVSAADQSPLGRLELRLGWSRPQSDDVLWKSAKTDDEGVFECVLPAQSRLRRLDIEPGQLTPPLVLGLGWRLEGGKTTTRRYELPHGGRLSGYVVDEFGQPLSAVTVLGHFDVRTPPYLRLGRKFSREVKTDGGGRFRFEPILGMYDLTVEAESRLGLTRASGRIEVGQVHDDLTLIATRLRTLRGRVLDRDGIPVEYALVTLWPKSPGFEGLMLAPTRTSFDGSESYTDEQGGFVSDALPTGPLMLSVTCHGYEWHEEELAAGVQEVDVRIGARLPSATVSGVVRDPRGAPIARAMVRIRTGAEHQRMRTDEHGGFRFEQIPFIASGSVLAEPGYRLLVLADGYEIFDRKFARSPEGPVEHELNLIDESVLSGVVRNREGLPIEKASVRIDPVGRAAMSEQLLSRVEHTWHKSDSKGRFHIGSLWPGEYRLWITAKGGRAVAIVSAPKEGIDLRLGDGAEHQLVLRLRVRDAASMQAIESAKLMIGNENGGTGSRKSLPGGLYEYSPRRPGMWYLSVQAEGYARWHMPLRHFEAGRHEIEARLERAHSLRLRVVDRQDEPIRGARVLPRNEQGKLIPFRDSDPPRHASGYPVTDWTGRIWFPALPAREIEFQVQTPDGESQAFSIDLSLPLTNEIELRL